MYTKFQRNWMLGSALRFDHEFSPGNQDKGAKKVRFKKL